MTADGRFLLPMKQFDYFVTSSDASLYGDAFRTSPPFIIFILLCKIYSKKKKCITT
jgi:hypothetical protein